MNEEIVELVARYSILVAAEKANLNVDTFKKRYKKEIEIGRKRRKKFKNMALDRMELVGVEERKCLGCDQRFISESKYNRLCLECQSFNSETGFEI